MTQISADVCFNYKNKLCFHFRYFLINTEMEMHKDSFSLCRFCLQTTEGTEEIFNPRMEYIKEIEELLGIKINYDLELPSHICEECQGVIKILKTFRERCRRSEELLSQIYKCRNIETTLEDSEKTLIINNPQEDAKSDKDVCEEKKSVEINLEGISTQGESEEHLQSNETAKKRISDQTVKKMNKNLITCHICGKQYEPSRLKYHLNNHAGHRPYACNHENCGKSFPSPFLLKSHNKICHTNFYPFTCDICGRQFKVRTTFLVHRSYHLDPDIPCTVCGKLVRNKRALKKHMMSHTGERPFSCNSCSKAFQNKYTLRIHQRVHTKEKPFICGKCGQSFGYNCLLKTHISRQHNDEDAIL